MNIRDVKTKDARSIARIYEPYVTDSVISFEDTAPDEEEMLKRINNIYPTLPWLVAENDNRDIVGYAYAAPHRGRKAYQWSVEVSVYVSQHFQRQKIGQALYKELLERLRQQGIANAYAGVTLPNPASVGFHESFGFEAIGVYKKVGYKFADWHDVGWWGLRLQDVDPER